MRAALIISACCVLGYLLGNVSFARIFSAINKKSIDSVGSGNPGTMNMLRNHGARLGVITLFFDALKGAIPALTAYLLHSAGISAVLGHVYPVFYKFRGGKGIATTIGVFAVADPLVTLALFLFIVLIVFFVKIGSLSSIILVVSFAIIESCKSINHNVVILILLYSIVFIDVFAHRANIARLFSEEERETDLISSIARESHSHFLLFLNIIESSCSYNQINTMEVL